MAGLVAMLSACTVSVDDHPTPTEAIAAVLRTRLAEAKAIKDDSVECIGVYGPNGLGDPAHDVTDDIRAAHLQRYPVSECRLDEKTLVYHVESNGRPARLFTCTASSATELFLPPPTDSVRVRCTISPRSIIDTMSTSVDIYDVHRRVTGVLTVKLVGAMVH
ncbi:MAG TPA: hypothetical protein VMB81_25080 [Candidatus Sulfotelmatobacter sp.]|nr:hypothetical protein [Candidatus Sulfotelmatobacter sp.]